MRDVEPPEVCFIKVAPTSTSNTIDLTGSQPTTQTQPTTTASTPLPTQPTATPATSTARPIPIHPHIYSNGIICLDLLGTAGWSPVQSVESVCMSIQSMLTGNTKNERPQGDEAFCRSMGVRGVDGWSSPGGGGRGGWGRGGRGLRDVRFAYDDDSV
jgi:ubiquitin-conjugating enzyme E2 W